MSLVSRLVAIVCLGLFTAACAPKPEPVVYSEPVTTEPTYTGKLN
jgi:hypothetical protein